MKRLIIVSNRLPVSIKKRHNSIKVEPSVGGLATGMKSFYKTHDSLWFGWPGIHTGQISPKERTEIATKLEDEKCKPVYLSRHDLNQYYYGFANKTLWPLFHYFTQYTTYREDYWRSYNKVNQIFARELLKEIREDDIVWIHDYHLFLLPQLIREKFPHIAIGFFLHIPFPSYEVFRLLPWRNQLMKGLLGADLLGFHTYDYQRHFISTVRRLLGKETYFNGILTDHREIKVDSFPMGIDYKRFEQKAKDIRESNVGRRSRIKTMVDTTTEKDSKLKLILSMDRLDYSKGIPQRLESFEYFLEKYPMYREKVSMILLAVPSRTTVDHYMNLKRYVDELIGRINGKYGTINWTPIKYFYRSLPFDQIVELYLYSDIALVTPVRDGMNLIAKEFMASKIDNRGVLILSEMAGSAQELGEALIVNPNDKNDMADSIKEALTMPEMEQEENNTRMQHRLKRYDVERWANDFMNSLNEIKKEQSQLLSKHITPTIIERIAQDYAKAKNRLLLLDYDGTLIPFSKEPYRAGPDKELRNILKSLTEEDKNALTLISGRDKETLSGWFNKFNLSLIAEHGVWLKDPGNHWKMIEPIRNDWKEDILPILEKFTDRTPGSFVEEKNYSLVWHYRKSDPELGSLRALELKDELISITVNLNLEILEGNRMLEIKTAGINKGRAIRKKIESKDLDFILAVGDDWTDEFLYEVLPDSAYSINVGFRSTDARYCLENVKDVRSLLKKLANID